MFDSQPHKNTPVDKTDLKKGQKNPKWRYCKALALVNLTVLYISNLKFCALEITISHLH